MRLLPKLLWPAGAVALPLSDRAAGGLVAALLSRDKQARQHQFAAAIAGEPSLALWTLCRFASVNHLPARGVWDLAGWLSEAQAADWFDGGRVRFPLGSLAEDQIAAWQRRSTVALEVAASAQQFAQRSQVDSDWTNLLALLHEAPEWLAAAVCDGAATEPATLLPDWLLGALAAMDSTAAAQPTSSACVAAALRLRQQRPATSGAGSASGCDAIVRPTLPAEMEASR
ncbi:MAG TPA: hypothetical protein VHV08_01560, partial [Pirellulales bacterium]|nr:hypothetical protein [Pirellulales bacterium]